MRVDIEMNELISISEAVDQGIQRLRMPRWANKLDHLKLHIIGGRLGPWVYLFAPFNKECNGRDPVPIPIWELDSEVKAYLSYEGPLPDSKEYKGAVADFDGCLAT